LPSTHTQAALDASSIAQQRARRFEPGEVRRALLRRLTRRWQASGSFTFPAVPALLERYLGQCLKLFEALGRHYADEQRREARGIFERVLQEAFTRSPRSNILVNYEAPMGTELHYAVTADAVSVTDMYEDWLERLPSPLFGDYPDARLSVLLRELGPERKLKVLDLGAGTGRNALYLAGLGHSVVAVESAPKLADLLRRAAAGSGLSLQVHTLDLFEQLASDPEVYSLIIMSGVASDLRRVEQLRYLFSLASQRLAPGGHLMLSLHVAVRDYAPDTAARQWAQQCCAMFFTREEIVSCTKESGLALGSDDSVCEFESAHLPVQAWPPTPAYVEWITCQHLFALPPERCPVELRWLVYHKPVT
jgi:protein-L-isoaspartate O-methyltransferase